MTDVCFLGVEYNICKILHFLSNVVCFSLLEVALFVTGGAATPSCHYNSILPPVSGFGDRKQGRVKINQRFVCSNGELIRYRANDGHPQAHLVITVRFPQFPPIRTSLPPLKMIKHIVIDYLPIMLVGFNYSLQANTRLNTIYFALACELDLTECHL